jgi:arylsulfatase A-like enzyme
MKDKNILFITADQWRGECLSLLAHPVVKTPSLDALAAEGVLFRRHFAQCAPCGPSRASIYTGMYLQNHRSVDNGTPLDARHTNVALEFRKRGYETVLVGYTDTSPDPRQLSPDDPALKTYEGILPGFQHVLAMPSETFPQPWARWLAARGFSLPDDLRDLYYGQVKAFPGADERGVSYAPAIYPPELSDTAFAVDLAMNYVRIPGSRPWFLHLSILAPHPPHVAPEPFNRMYHPDDVPPLQRAASLEEEAGQHPFLGHFLDQNLRGSWGEHRYPRDEMTMRQLRATYYGQITHVDECIGKLIDLLKETGQYDETIIVFGSDHGDQMGDHYLLGKGAYFDQSAYIPLIIRVPGDSKHGRVVESFTENVDILPTLLDLVGSETPLQCDGRSLVPFLNGDTPADWRTAAHWEVDFRDVEHGLPEKQLGIGFEECCYNVIRDERYKYVHFAVLPPLLFDLEKDPAELNNLARDPACTPLLLKYAQQLLSWRMVNDERTLTHMKLGPQGVITRQR